LTCAAAGYFGWKQFWPPATTEASADLPPAEASTGKEPRLATDAASNTSDELEMSLDEEFEDDTVEGPRGRAVAGGVQAAGLRRKPAASDHGGDMALENDEPNEEQPGVASSSPLRQGRQKPPSLEVPLDLDAQTEGSSPLDQNDEQPALSVPRKAAGSGLGGRPAAKAPERGGIKRVDHRDNSADPQTGAFDMEDEPDDNAQVNLDETPELEGLDGYVPERLSVRRAASKTLVKRADATSAPRRSRVSADQDEFAFEDDSTVTVAGSERPVGMRPGNPATEAYIVRPNDSFWSISRSLYGTARYAEALARHNKDRVPEATRLRPGTRIATPAAALLEKNYASLISAGRSQGAPPAGDAATDEANPPTQALNAAGLSSRSGFFVSREGIPMYRVAEGDTLSEIARRHLGKSSRADEIYRLNEARLSSPDELVVGTLIRLPADASRVGLVPSNERRR
jgi:nucleoid-associated protein YgaU